jgi:hypothetical protein
LRGEYKPRVSENRFLRKIFEPKRKEDGSWRKLHVDKLHSLCSSCNIVRVVKEYEVGGICSTHGKGRGV